MDDYAITVPEMRALIRKFLLWTTDEFRYIYLTTGGDVNYSNEMLATGSRYWTRESCRAFLIRVTTT